ncbi:hypothetical protein MMC07_003422 [Pseudocyphellaria aurata]|nr:hypothetical protein [Pseudocyphellaria aurata]
MSPDLASVLRTLAYYTSPQPPISHPPPNPPLPSGTLEDGDEEDEEEYDPSNFVPTTTTPPESVVPTLQPRPRHSDPVAAPPLPPSSLSSSIITTWPPALRYVMNTLIPNQAATLRIRHLIKTQREHEQQWWAGREALVQKQEGREEGRRRLNDVLASVGGLVNPLNEDSSPETDRNELLLYDRKVHRACADMVAATTAELARLGVPFFNTRSDLLSKSDATRHTAQLDNHQLRELQNKMLVLLEDLCSE